MGTFFFFNEIGNKNKKVEVKKKNVPI